jgi:hypothetical protein
LALSVTPISVSSAAAWTAVRSTGNSVLGSGRAFRLALGTPRGCAGCGSRFDFAVADLGLAGVGLEAVGFGGFEGFVAAGRADFLARGAGVALARVVVLVLATGCGFSWVACRA